MSLMSGTHAVFSEAAAADVEAIATFCWAAWEEAGPDAPGWAGASDEAIRAITAPENLRRQVGGADGRIFLARESDAIVGFAATRRMDDDSVELAGIIVLQSQLGCGIGSGLLAAAVDAAHRDGYRRIVVRTEVDNERALAFYKAKGFVAVQRMPDPSVSVEVWELVRGL